MSGSETSFPLPRPLVVALLVLGIAVSVTVVPGVFVVDDNNYLINVLALRQGRFTVANTEGLSPSRELLAFDPGPWARAVDSTPVASTAPPLYALLALPFSSLGWRGLVALNTLAYLATIVMVFLYTRRYATEASTPWLAAAAFALGGFVIEYAQGVWPHALSIALCTGGIIRRRPSIESRESGDSSYNGRPSLAAAAGFLLGLATGVRYQNAVILAVVAGGIALWSAHRWKALTAFVLAAAVPLAASAAINHVRLGSWNPISKGPGYLRVPLVEDPAASLFDPLVMFWARVVDFSCPAAARLVLLGDLRPRDWRASHDRRDAAEVAPAIGAMGDPGVDHVRGGLAALVPDAGSTSAADPTAVAGHPWDHVPFAFAGVRRHEGLSFNQRYLLELLPLAAVGFAWALDGLELSVRPVFVGASGVSCSSC